ncbi:MAG: hypothetical protein SXA11_21250 [Cyanobacteriota bacterium]|nr:hypothetical protein [Cyanobacteriota bacterium]
MIRGEGFTIDEKKFDFFFGRVTSNPKNASRSLQNLRELRRLGIEEAQGGTERLLQIFQEGLNASQIEEIATPHGVTIVRKVEVNRGEILGAIEISYFYQNGDFNSLPKVTTIIPKIYQ